MTINLLYLQNSDNQILSFKAVYFIFLARKWVIA